jgi:hypothetical protein
LLADFASGRIAQNSEDSRTKDRPERNVAEPSPGRPPPVGHGEPRRANDPAGARIIVAMRGLKLCAALTGAAILGCSPALDWRDVRPEGSGATALFPCKPDSQARGMTLAGARVHMTLVSCEVDGVTFALSHADLGDPSRVTTGLIEMRLALAGNLGTSDVRSAAFQVTGMTPNPQALRIRLAGHRPDGTPVQLRAALFARGTSAFQAVVLGTRIDDVAADVFFDNLRIHS